MNSARPDTGPVRASEELNWEALAAYVREKLGVTAPLTVEQFPGGHSNLTYLLRFGDQEFVLRRPPFGPVPPTAHDMAREYRMLAALSPIYPLAPRPELLCEDQSIIGSVFYLMERRRGLVVRGDEPPELAGRPAERRRASTALVDGLADLHLIDLETHGLGALGKPAGFVERQVRGWRERWYRSQTSELPEMNQLAAWLLERLPPDPAKPAMIHGDYRLDNVMLDAQDVGRLVAVFDWEMSALGDPLVDLGILLGYSIHIPLVSQEEETRPLTTLEGWFSREEILEHYASRTGLDLSRIAFYEVLAIFKLAVVMQQIFYRYHHGQTDDPRFAGLDLRVAKLAQIATELAEEKGRS